MSEESETSDHAELIRGYLELMDRDWDQGKIVRITTYTDIDQARAAAERLAEERE